MTLPDVIVEADFTTLALVIPDDWTDLSSRFRYGTIEQGRQRVLDRTETGRAQVTLDNADRALDPTIAPNVRPLNHLRIKALYAGVQYPLFRGYVQSWPQEWPAQGIDAISTVDAEDAFSLLSRYELEGQAIAEMGTGAHLESVLTTFGWPATGEVPVGKTWWQLGTTGKSELGTNTILGENLSAIETGRHTIMATTLTGNLLDHLLNAAETTDGGTFYAGPNGDLIFLERPSPFDEPLGIWGDLPGSGENRYSDLVMIYGVSQVFNDVRVQRRGDASAEIATQTTDFWGTTNAGPRTLSHTDVLFSTVAAATVRADELLQQYKEPALHPIRMVMRPKPDAWPTIFGVQLMDRITVRKRPPGGGALLEFDCLITGITHEIGSDDWTVSWALDPAEPILAGHWYLGHPGFSELGTTTKLA